MEHLHSKPRLLRSVLRPLPLAQIEDHGILWYLPVPANAKGRDGSLIEQVIRRVAAYVQNFPKVGYGDKVIILLQHGDVNSFCLIYYSVRSVLKKAYSWNLSSISCYLTLKNTNKVVIYPRKERIT